MRPLPRRGQLALTSFSLGPYVVEVPLNRLRRENQTVQLEPKIMQVLLRLAERHGQVVNKEQLIQLVWADTFVSDDVLTRSISVLRKVLDDDSRKPRFIETIPRSGYRLIGPISFATEVTDVVGGASRAETNSLFPGAGNHLSSSAKESTPSVSEKAACVPKPEPVVAHGVVDGGRFRAVRLLALAVAGLGIAFGFGAWKLWPGIQQRNSITPISSLAVLPLDNLSGDSSQEYFADGMTDELITHLAQIKSLRVISRTSVMQYKQIRKPLPEIARALAVDAIVEGSVARSGDKVRITAQLIDARSDRHVWAEDFDSNTGDLLALQSQIARAITQAVSLNTADVERSNVSAATGVSPEAYDDYLKCRYFWARRNAVDLRRSVQACEEAVAKDPNFARAWAQLADSYMTYATYAGEPYPGTPTGEGRRRVKAAAEKAVSLDNGSADAHTAMGMIKEDEWKWEEAGSEYETAIRLNPNSARAHQLYASYLSAMGRHEESLRQILIAEQVDPISLIIRAHVGAVLGRARRFEDGAAACGKVLELDAGFAPAHICLGWNYEYLGKYKEAIAEYKKALSLEGGPPDTSKTASLARAYAVAGEHRRAREIVSRLESQPFEDLEPYEIAVIHAALGNRDRAIEFLTVASVYHDGQLEFIATDPDLDSLRADPRFQELLAKLGLPGPTPQNH